MLYWRRAGQREQNRCKWRSFYENAQVQTHRVGVVLGALAFALVGCGGSDDKSSEDVPDDAVALVGDRGGHQGAVRRADRTGEGERGAAEAHLPEGRHAEYKNLQNQGLEYLIRRAEFEQKAKDMDVEVTDKQVNERLEQLKKQFYGGDDKKFKASLKKLLLTEDQVKKDVRAQLLEEQPTRRSPRT